MDVLDHRILACLQESARRSNCEVGKDLGVSESTVRKRLARMLDENLIRIVAVADPLKIGYPVVAVIGFRCLPSALTRVETALAGLDEFRFIGMTTGAYDFVAEAWFQSMGELSAFITDRLGGIEDLREIETASVLKMVRYAYDWGRPAAGHPLTQTTEGSHGAAPPVSTARRATSSRRNTAAAVSANSGG